MRCSRDIFGRSDSKGFWAAVTTGSRTRKWIAPSLFLALVCALAGNAGAATIAQIEGQISGTPAILDSNAVITTILSKPETVNGKTTAYWAFLVNDGTGSAEIFSAASAFNGYTPTVGDAVNLTGPYSLYNDIPEIGGSGASSLTSITKISSGNLVAAPTTTTIPTLQVVANSGPGFGPDFTQLGYALQVKNVMVSGLNPTGGTFGTGSLTGTITDASGNSMTLYYWPTSYSTANRNLYGTSIPTDWVTITGFASVYNGGGVPTPEFVPLSISPSVPATWLPSSSNSSTWDGTTQSWRITGSPTADVTGLNVLFDNTGVPDGKTVNISGPQSVGVVTVSNSSGTYTFNGDSVSAGRLSKTGAGTLVVNNTLQMPVTATAGTLVVNGTVQNPVTLTGGSASSVTLSGSGTIGGLIAGSFTTVTPGSLTTPGNLTINGTGGSSLAAGSTYAWKLGALSTSNPGTDWDQLTFINGGTLALGGSSSLSLNFVNGINTPNNASETYWTSAIHSWTITSGAGIKSLFNSITNPSWADGSFTTSVTAGDVVLRYTPTALGPRNLTWAGIAGNPPTDFSGTWDASTANWSLGGGSNSIVFDSTRPDNAIFGTSGGTTGADVTVNLSGTATANSFNFLGNSAKYKLTGGTLMVMSGGTASQSTEIASNVELGSQSSNQVWNIASGTLTASGGISDTSTTGGLVSSLTKAGSGTLALKTVPVSYQGGTIINGGGLMLLDDNLLPVAPLRLANSAGVLFNINGKTAAVGALNGGGTTGGTLSLNGGSLTIGDANDANFAGVIQGTGILTKTGAGWQTLSGTNTFIAPINVNAGELQVSKDVNLGNSSNALNLTNGGALGATATLSSSRTVTLGSNGNDTGILYVANSLTTTPYVLTLSGQVTGPGALTKKGQGTLLLSNTNNNYQGNTVLDAGVLSIGSSANIGSGDVTFTGNGYNTTLQFTSPMTLPNNIHFPLSGSSYCYLDTQGNNVTLSGQLLVNGTSASVSFDKSGTGTLTLTGTTGTPYGTFGTTYIQQGTLKISAAYLGYSELSSGPIQVSSGAVLQLDGVALGYQSSAGTGVTGAVGYVELSNGATLKGSGSSSYAHGAISDVLSITGSGIATIQTASSSDVLNILDSIQQYDPNFTNNRAGNALWNISTGRYNSDPQKLTEMHVAGPGRVQLRDGGVYNSYSDNSFGGDWVVDSGVLQVGPYQSPTGGWTQQGQLLNALGFKTINGQGAVVQGDSDIPNGLTVNSGGMFAVAVDQVNPTGGTTATNATNAVDITPAYLRNPIALSGGTLAATGYEMNFVTGTISTTAVTAKLGGDFSVNPTNSSGTSTIATYDPIGGNGTRTVQLLSGSHSITTTTAAFAAGTTLKYNTSWNGTLNVDGGPNHVGEFDLYRDTGGTVTVASGAKINLLNGATVKVGGTEKYASLYDETGGTNSVNFSGDTGTHLVFARSASLNYSGNIGGGLDLKQSGSGLLVLSGNNNYTGGTTVSSGTLAITSASALPSGYRLTVGAGGTLIFDPSLSFSPLVSESVTFAGTATAAVPEPASLTLLLVLAGCGGE